MSATTVVGPGTAGKSWTHATRVTLITLAIVALLAVSIVLEISTVSPAQPTPKVVPASGTPTPAYICRMGRPC